MMYAPPPGPPPRRPLLTKVSSISLPYKIDFEHLAQQGWISLPLHDSPSDPLFLAFSKLFLASAQFFALSEADKDKYHVPSRPGFQQSEEGYSRIPGEKSMLTLRKAQTIPNKSRLREHAENAWRASSELMSCVLTAIEESLDMIPGTLTRIAEVQLALPPEGAEDVATLMRMFRYERPPSDEPSRVVAEGHKDLGLLSLVVGHSPGLECWDSTGQCWVSCEEGNKLDITLLVGQTLARFTNWRYVAGRHRVFIYPRPASQRSEDQYEDEPLKSTAYRFSIVHALRGHMPLKVSHRDFQTSVTGSYAPEMQFNNVTVGDIYREISNSSWNVNISVKERLEQLARVQDRVRLEWQKRHVGTDNMDNNEEVDGIL